MNSFFFVSFLATLINGFGPFNFFAAFTRSSFNAETHRE
jgi:hypothetical protein